MCKDKAASVRLSKYPRGTNKPELTTGVPSGKAVKFPSDTAAAIPRPCVHSLSGRTGPHKPPGSLKERNGQEAGSHSGQTGPAWENISPGCNNQCRDIALNRFIYGINC